MAKSKRQIYLEKELKEEKIKISNKSFIKSAQKFQKELRAHATLAEKKLLKALSDSPLKDMYEFQHIIYIKRHTKIVKFFIADFCFPIRKIIIELDGEYHYTQQQALIDNFRTNLLKKQGYKVYRIDNSKILGSKDLKSLIRELIKLLSK